jgi:serine/threonine protein kinase
MSWIREADQEPIPGYRLIRPIGSGGFGEVWLCQAPGEIQKAIKFVFGNLDASSSGDGRARQEFHALQQVKEVRHPFVLSIERIDILEGEVAIVMELAEKSLYDVLQERRQEGFPGIERAKLLRYMADTADGLDYLGETHNLMHLDVKPRNLFLVGDHVKVADFGLTKHLERHSSTGIMAGISPQYAAPETFTNRLTKFSDQYSLAIVYTELLVGRRPFTGKTIRELALQHMNSEPDLSGLPERDRRAVAKSLAKDPQKRFPSCKEFIEALPRGPSTHGDVFEQPAFPTRLAPPAGETAHNEFEAAPRTLPFDVQPGPRTGRAKSAEASGSLTGPTVVPFAEVVGEAQPKIEDSQQVNFDFPEADGAVLRPTLVIGVGGFGLLALRELRSRLTDKMGDLRQTPAVRFLYLDADPDARSTGMSGSPDRALGLEHIFPTPLHPVTRYRRQALDLLSEWLPREKLHAIPRNMNPKGSRALGRLAFTENYLRFVTRVRRELEIAAHPESLTRTTENSGLPARDTRPRVFVLAGAGGASSGALPDVGYAISRLLTQLKLPPQVTAFLFLGAPADPTTPPDECANVYATLTELNHYGDESITFRSRYGGPDGPQVEASAAPFDTIYLLQRSGRGPAAAAECAERLAAYLCLDLTTSLGAELDKARSAGRGQFRSFGTGGVWFPRGLLLRSASRYVCERLIQEWQGNGPVSGPGVAEACGKALADPALQPGRVINQITATVRAADNNPIEQLAKLLTSLETKINSADNPPADWAQNAYEAIVTVAGARGSIDPADTARSGRLTKAYIGAAGAVGDTWVRKLAGEALALLALPGRRVAAAEAGLARFIEFCDQAEQAAAWQAHELGKRSEQAFAQVKAAAEVCTHGGRFSLFGNKDLKHMRALLVAITQYAAARTDEEGQVAAVRFYKKLTAGLEDRQRELTICRQRLTHLRRALEVPETAGASILGGPSPTVELLLPDGGEEVEWAAKRFVESICAEDLTKLDQALQVLVLEPRGGLFGACQKAGDFLHELADPLIDQTSAYLGTLLPSADVAEFPERTGADWDRRLERSFDRATPTVPGSPDRETAYLLVPDTHSGDRLSARVKTTRPDVTVIRASRANEVTFCRETKLRQTNVGETLHFCREAYEERAARPAPSPHARFDVVEWLPLDV